MSSIRPKVLHEVRGIFTRGIPYEIRNPSGDWSEYFGQWEGQKKDWFDTNSCWAYAGNEVLEDQMEFLAKTGQFSIGDMEWFTSNGYIDEDGDFYFSRRFIPIISGAKNNGNDEAEFWRLTKKYGAIPSAMLPYTNQVDYFNEDCLTNEMLNLGAEFLKRVTIRYEELGHRWSTRKPEMIKAALFQTELQIGIPVPYSALWNKEKVDWDGNKVPAHSVALYKYDDKDPDYPYCIYDQYTPYLKKLSKNYCIPIITKAVILPKVQTANAVSQTTWGALIWRAIARWFGFDVVDMQVKPA